MKKYCYSPLAYWIQNLFGVIICGFVDLGFYFIYPVTELIVRIVIGTIAIYIFWIYKFRDCWLKRCVIIYDNSILFSNFFIESNVTEDYNIKIDEITSLKAVVLPFFGIYSVKVFTNKYSKSFTINPYFKNRKECYAEIYKTVKRCNNEALIDKKLEKLVTEWESDLS